MATITRIARLIDGVVRGIDLTTNSLQMRSLILDDGSTTVELTKAYLSTLVSGSADASSLHNHDGRYYTESEIGSSSSSSGSDLIGDDNTYTNFTPAAATVKGALAGINTAIGTTNTNVTNLTTTVTTHLNGGASKHDASEIDVENSYSNIGITAPTNVESALGSIDTKFGAVVSMINALEFQDSVKDRLATPPVSPTTGDRYLIIATATGAWAGKENYITTYNGTAWVFTAPATGMWVSVDDETTVLYYYGGSSWSTKSFESSTAGTAIDITAGAVSVKYDNVSIGVNGSNQIYVKAAGIKVSMIDFGTGATQVNADDIALDGTWNPVTGAISTSDTIQLVLEKIHYQLTAHTGASSGAHAATAISVSPSGNLASTTVQAALLELQGDIDTLQSGTSAVYETFLAGETFAAGTYAVRLGTIGTEDATRVYKAEIDTSGGDKFWVIGVTTTAGVSAGGSMTVYKLGTFTLTAHSLGTRGVLFLRGGGLIAATVDTTPGNAVVKLGYIKGANTIEIHPQVMYVV